MILVLGTLLISVILTYKAVSLVVRPLASMEEFLDKVDLDLDMPSEGPVLKSSLPEVSRRVQKTP